MHPHDSKYSPRLIAKLEAGIDKRGPDECWLWTRCVRLGYGCIKELQGPERKMQRFATHRVAYELAYGPIPQGQCVHHLCEARYPRGDSTSRRCCNPAHLAVVSRGDNTRHCARNGRQARGDQLPWTKLTQAQVRAIRAAYVRHEATHRALADQYGVHESAIAAIVQGRHWTYVDD